MHVDDHRLYLSDTWRSGRLGETRVIDVVDVEEVVVLYDVVRNIAVPLWMSTRTERRTAQLSVLALNAALDSSSSIGGVHKAQERRRGSLVAGVIRVHPPLAGD